MTKQEDWTEGISDGLILPCAVCGREKIQFDYTVTDELWRDIVPAKMRLGVVCLPCLDKLTKERGADLGANIICLQFTGQDITIKFIPHSVYHYTTQDKLCMEHQAGQLKKEDCWFCKSKEEQDRILERVRSKLSTPVRHD